MEMVFGLLLIIALICFFVFRNSIKGKIGEEKTTLVLETLPHHSYRVINDLLINQNGHSSQIDHVVISEFGIFVIETKNYKGWIYGGDNSEYWTQNIYGNKYKLRNPILQNQGHIYALNKILKVNPGAFVSIVAFSGKANLKSRFTEHVVYISQIRKLILSYKQKCLTSESVEWIYNKLLEINVNSRENRKLHINQVKDSIARQNIAIANGLCPRCGGKLVLKTGKYGMFYGCKNFPNCTYTHPY